MPETAIGFFTDVGVGSFFLSKLKRNVGCYLALGGNKVKGKDNKRLGIATHFVNSTNLTKLEQELCDNHDLTLENIDSILNKYNEPVEGEFENIEKISTLFNANSVEDIIENLLNDKSDWSMKQLKVLGRMSPMALKVVFKLLKHCHNLTLADCLQLEYQITQNFINKSDFIEGVRALLIDKDNSPKWKPATLSEISQQQVDDYFKPVPNGMKLILE
jgi:3-hydroxyisobutyryl-CoA hydrolase